MKPRLSEEMVRRGRTGRYIERLSEDNEPGMYIYQLFPNEMMPATVVKVITAAEATRLITEQRGWRIWEGD